MQNLYRCVFDESIEQRNINFLNRLFRVVDCQPHFINNRSTMLQDMYWYTIAFLSGGYRIYKVLTKDDEVIHTSYVIQSRLKFCFMKKGNIEIGPCQPEETYRGKGIYPFVLYQILKDYSNKNEECVAWMIINENNIASVKWVEKFGLQLDGKVKRNRWKQYVRI